jgi:hypothetical protein
MSDPSHSKPRRNRAGRPSAEPASAQDHGDPAALAERFLDLWQDQLASVATDPDLAELVARLWSQWLVGPTAWRPAPAAAPARPSAARPARPRGPRQHDTTGKAGDAEAPRSAPAAAASGDRGADVGDLLARIGTLEKRLAALERTPRRRSGGAERRTRRR